MGGDGFWIVLVLGLVSYLASFPLAVAAERAKHNDGPEDTLRKASWGFGVTGMVLMLAYALDGTSFWTRLGKYAAVGIFFVASAVGGMVVPLFVGVFIAGDPRIETSRTGPTNSKSRRAKERDRGDLRGPRGPRDW